MSTAILQIQWRFDARCAPLMIRRSDAKGVDMADEETLSNATDPRDLTKSEQVERKDQQEPQSQAVGDARPDQPAPRGRMPLFGT